MVTGEGSGVDPSDETTHSMRGCTSEVINYFLECQSWRMEERRRQYLGETFRYAYQRGIEHMREV